MLVVDHYALDRRWQRAVHRPGLKVGVIDDLADRPHECHWLLDQNLGRELGDYRALVPDPCTCLIGPDYALLRPEFRHWRDKSFARRERVFRPKKLLITMGGVDRDNATGKLLSALADGGIPTGMEVDVVLGETSPWVESIQAQLDELPVAHRLSVNVEDMAQRLAETDLCIGAAGSSAWERCCLGVPSWVVVLADNQRPIAQALQKSGIAQTLEPEKEGYHSLIQQLNAPAALAQQMRAMTEACKQVFDGAGVTRVADAVKWSLVS